MLGAGTVIAGYRIEGLLGRGGMGVVYEATQLSLNRKVALKLLSAELSGDPAFASRFRREAELQAALDHPHVVTVHEAGQSPEGLYIAMRLVRGGTLRDRILEGEPDPVAWLPILRPIASALDAAHEAGLVHRDVKPPNILLDNRGHAYLSDFGITKAAEGTTLTASGQVMGTPDYIPPEQVEGHPAIPAGDIYALAAVAFECLTGTGPFPRPTPMAILFAHVNHPPPPASDHDPTLGPAVDAVLARGLAKRPQDRPQSATALVEELAEALAQRPADTPTTPVPRPRLVVVPSEPTTPKPTPAPAPAAPVTATAAPAQVAATPRRRRAGLLAGAVALIVAGIVVVALVAGGDDERERAASPAAADTTRLGSPLLENGERGPCFGEGSGQADACTMLQTELPGEELTAPRDSVITSWGLRNATGRFRLQVLHQEGDTYEQVGMSEEVSATGATDRFPARIPIANGDTIALFAYRNAQAAIISGEGHLARFKPPLGEEARVADYGQEAGFHLLFGAELEPDADSDGWGDGSQDGCPRERGDDKGCPG